MGEITQSVKVNGVKVKALIDTGATENYLSSRIAKKVRLYLREKYEFEVANGEKEVGHFSNIGITIFKRFGSTEVVVTNILPRDGYDLILGQKFLQDNEVKLDFKKDKMLYGSHQPRMRRIGRL